MLRGGVNPSILTKITGHKNLNLIINYTQEIEAMETLEKFVELARCPVLEIASPSSSCDSMNSSIYSATSRLIPSFNARYTRAEINLLNSKTRPPFLGDNSSKTFIPLLSIFLFALRGIDFIDTRTT